MLLPIIQEHVKTQASKEKRMAGCIRAIDPIMCPHFCLGILLVITFTIQGQAWPSLAEEKTLEWNNFFIFGGGTFDRLMSWAG